MYCIISVVYDYITILNTILMSYNTQLVDPTLQLFVIPLILVLIDNHVVHHNSRICHYILSAIFTINITIDFSYN
jgi:hypothetical protein